MKRILALFLCAIFVLACSLTVYAHPGRTDSNGGHWNRSTGEYHYHHGYSEHDHYDMDGDGDADCPYNFVDKTTTNSGNTSTNVKSSKTGQNATTGSAKTVQKQGIDMEQIKGYLISCVIGLIIGFIIKGRSARKEIAALSERKQNEINKLDSKLKTMREWIRAEVLQRQKRTLDEELQKRRELVAQYPPTAKVNFRDPHPFSLFESFNNEKDPFSLPPGVYIEDNAFLSLGVKSDFYPYGNYTVFIRPGAEVYHTSQSCHGHNFLQPENIMRVLETRRPCAFCGHGMPQTNRLPKWYVNFRNASINMEIEW